MSRLANPNYKVQITNHATNEEVMGYLPEQFQLQINSDWEPVLANKLNQGALGAASDAARVLFGMSPNNKALTGQVWRGSEPLDFSIQLLFDAETDTNKDVTLPVQKLISWAMPIRDDYVLKAPGPTIWDQTNRMSLRIGRYLFLDNVIFPHVDITWYTAPDSKGEFIAADVALSVRTFFTPDRTDVMSFFGRGPSSNTNSLYVPSESAAAKARELTGNLFGRSGLSTTGDNSAGGIGEG